MENEWDGSWIYVHENINPRKERSSERFTFRSPVETGMSTKEAEILIGLLELSEIPELEKVLERLKSGLSFAERHK